ncbi:MAG: hypothetical protein JKX68_08565, partial [Flavobacteriales bacterium]|nr:hypothetical protein [Flavobacteriales bacterium]
MSDFTMTYFKKYILLVGLIFPLLSFAGTSFFIKNEGILIDEKGKQIEGVEYFFKGKSFDVYFHKDKISYVFKKSKYNKEVNPIFNGLNPSYSVLRYRVDLEFLFLKKAKILFKKPVEINHKYLNTSVGELTIKNGYQEIVYKNIYEGIDLRFYFQNDLLKYDFIVYPNGDYKDIKMKYSGAESVINKSSKIIIKTPLGNLEETIPEIYQQTILGKENILGNYVLEKGVISFQIENYKSNQKLIIDP